MHTLDPYSQSNRKLAILMCGSIFPKFMPPLKMISSKTLHATVLIIIIIIIIIITIIIITIISSSSSLY